MKKILIIDDESHIRLMLQDLFESEYEVTCAANGREALEILEQAAFDLIITDLVMPELNGIDLVMSVRQKNPNQKIIAMSGGGGVKGHFDYLPVVQLIGANKIFAKPFQLNHIMTEVNEMLI